MKYAVVKISNDAFFIDSEWAELDKAIVKFHSVCMGMWNASDVESATVAIIDSKMRFISGYFEKIKYES